MAKRTKARKPKGAASKSSKGVASEAIKSKQTAIYVSLGGIVLSCLYLFFVPTTVDKKLLQSFDKSIGGLTLAVHRNGESQPLLINSLPEDGIEVFHQALQNFTTRYGTPIDKITPYEFDSILTTFASSVLGWEDYLTFCDGGKNQTPVLPDHNKLVPVLSSRTLPCHFHTREGVRINSIQQLIDIAKNARTSCLSAEPDECAASSNELHLYAVPAGRLFVFSTSHVGERFELPHVPAPDGKPISLEVISENPRLFEIHNFFSRDEALQIAEEAQSLEEDGLKRSTVKGNQTTSTRTSETCFIRQTEIRKRCFQLLGFNNFIESFSDKLQVVRYNESSAYVAHYDYTDRYREGHNYDSAGVGTNRFATILLYLNDMEDNTGGETVFPMAWPEGERVELQEAMSTLKESDESIQTLLEADSWEFEMVAKCRSRLSIKPRIARAVLFYSQNPSGERDNWSLHGGCPVLKGTKLMANLWVWNGPRKGEQGAPPYDVENSKQNRKPQLKLQTFTVSSEGQSGQIKLAV